MKELLKNKSVIGLIIVFWGLTDFFLFRIGIDLYGLIGLELPAQYFIFSHLYVVSFGLTYIYLFPKKSSNNKQSEAKIFKKKHNDSLNLREILTSLLIKISKLLIEIPKLFLQEIKKFSYFLRKWVIDNKKKIISNILAIIYALIIALLIRTFLIQPFFIPSSSMEPGLKTGDRLFASKYDYGYSKHSFPFSLGPISNRIFPRIPERGDVIIFKPPHTNLDYIKRLIGLPGDKIQMKNGKLFINDAMVENIKSREERKILKNGRVLSIEVVEETLKNGLSYETFNYINNSPSDNTKEFLVPVDHYFFIGDNRDNSNDSRFWGPVHYERIVGKAKIKFFSTKNGSPIYNLILKLPFKVEYNRILKPIH